MVQSLQLSDKVQEKHLRGLLALNSREPDLHGDPSRQFESLLQRLKNNEILHQMKFPANEIAMCKGLVHNQFALWEHFAKEWSFVKYPDLSNGRHEYQAMITGLLGLLSGAILEDSKVFNLAQFIKELYAKLK